MIAMGRHEIDDFLRSHLLWLILVNFGLIIILKLNHKSIVPDLIQFVVLLATLILEHLRLKWAGFSLSVLANVGLMTFSLCCIAAPGQSLPETTPPDITTTGSPPEEPRPDPPPPNHPSSENPPPEEVVSEDTTTIVTIPVEPPKPVCGDLLIRIPSAFRFGELTINGNTMSVRGRHQYRTQICHDQEVKVSARAGYFFANAETRVEFGGVNQLSLQSRLENFDFSSKNFRERQGSRHSRGTLTITDDFIEFDYERKNKVRRFYWNDVEEVLIKRNGTAVICLKKGKGKNFRIQNPFHKDLKEALKYCGVKFR